MDHKKKKKTISTSRAGAACRSLARGCAFSLLPSLLWEAAPRPCSGSVVLRGSSSGGLLLLLLAAKERENQSSIKENDDDRRLASKALPRFLPIFFSPSTQPRFRRRRSAARAIKVPSTSGGCFERSRDGKRTRENPGKKKLGDDD